MHSLFTCTPDRHDFLGACMDSGAARSVVGRNQARAYTRLTGTLTMANMTTPAKFMFGGTITPSLRTINMRVPIASTLYANLLIDVADVDVPFLMGLDALDALGLYIKNVDNMLKCDKRGIATPLTRKDGHTYLE